MVAFNKQPVKAISMQKRGGEGLWSDVDKKDLVTVHETTDAYESVTNMDNWMASSYWKENAL